MIKMNKDRLDVSDVHHSKAQLYEVITKAPLFGNKRNPCDVNDYGDAATIGLYVIRINTGQSQALDYGVYLGPYQGRYHIGIFERDSYRPARLESYETLDAMKTEWFLDWADHKTAVGL